MPTSIAKISFNLKLRGLVNYAGINLPKLHLQLETVVLDMVLCHCRHCCEKSRSRKKSLTVLELQKLLDTGIVWGVYFIQYICCWKGAWWGSFPCRNIRKRTRQFEARMKLRTRDASCHIDG